MSQLIFRMEIKEYFIGIAIFILTLFVVIYGINTFYPNPEYNDFCEDEKTSPSTRLNTSQACEESGGKWNSYDAPSVPQKEARGYCDLSYYCREDYQNAEEKHDMIVFIVSIPLGILIILAGLFFFRLDSTSFGLMAGGVATLIYGAGTYWQHGENWFKFLISFIGLIALIFIAHWFDKRFIKTGKGKNNKKK